jgi:hypothetical protein
MAETPGSTARCLHSTKQFPLLAVCLALSPLFFPPLSAAQTVFATEPLLALPDGEESWVIHIERRGGLVDTREHVVTIASSGQLACGGQLRCGVDRVGTEALAKIAAQISTLPSRGSDVVSVCSDCPFTVLTVRHRQSPSEVIDRIFSWTAESKRASNIAKQLYEIVVLEVVP